MKKLTKIICILSALCILCSCSKLALENDSAAADTPDNEAPPPVHSETDSDPVTSGDTEADVADGDDTAAPNAVFRTFTSYDDIFSVINGSADIAYGAVPEEIVPDTHHTLTSVNGSAGQIAQLNPSATDGELLYTVYWGKLVISSEEEVLSETFLFTPEYSVEDAHNYVYGTENVSGVFLSDSVLTIVTLMYEYSDESGEVYRVNIYFYDVSDPAAPVLKTTLSQDGTFLSALVQDGKLYTVSSKSIKSAEEENIATFVPHTYDYGSVIPGSVLNSGATPIAAEKISVFEYSTCTSYTVTTVCDIASNTFTDSAAVLGGIGRFYADSSDIYMLFFTETSDMNSSRTEDNYEISEHTEHSSTAVIKYPLNGSLTPSCEALVDGCFTNDFSIHSLNGTLYFCAVSVHTDYSLYTDTESGSTEKKYTTSEISSIFYELSPDFTNLKSTVLPDTEIASVRFANKYMRIDYYSSVEYFDITAGQIAEGISFSEYMCKYDDGLVLGITRADDETLSLTMYNEDDLSVHSYADITVTTGYLDTASVQIHSEAGIITIHAGLGKQCIIGFDENGFGLRAVASITGLAHSAVTENAVFIITDSASADRIAVFTADGSTETASFDLTAFEGAVG